MSSSIVVKIEQLLQYIADQIESPFDNFGLLVVVNFDSEFLAGSNIKFYLQFLADHVPVALL